MNKLHKIAQLARRLSFDHFVLSIRHAGHSTLEDEVAYRHHRHYANEYRDIAREASQQLNRTAPDATPTIADLL